MGAAWVAGSVRAHLLLQHRAGSGTALAVAEAGSFDEAAALLVEAGVLPEGRVWSLEGAQREVAASLALQVRLLAGWVPRDAAGALRALGSWFELANLEDRLASFGGAGLRPPYELGTLSSVWAEAASCQSPEELRRLLARSSWADPGSNDVEEVHLALRLAWARRVSAQVPVARPWAAGAVALLLAAELFVAGRTPDDELVRRVGLGSVWRDAASLAELRERLPTVASWALEGAEEPEHLWHSELTWWRRVAADAERLVRGRLDQGDVMVGAVVLLAFDAMLLATALAVAATGVGEPSREVLDALC
jgi:hypothetical protein